MASTVGVRRYLSITTSRCGSLSGWFFAFPLHFGEVIGVGLDQHFRFVVYDTHLLSKLEGLRLTRYERSGDS